MLNPIKDAYEWGKAGIKFGYHTIKLGIDIAVIYALISAGSYLFKGCAAGDTNAMGNTIGNTIGRTRGIEDRLKHNHIAYENHIKHDEHYGLFLGKHIISSEEQKQYGR